MMSLLKKLSIFMKIGVIKRYRVCLVSFQISSPESVGSRRELVANFVHTADADATKQFRCVGVGGVYWTKPTNHWFADKHGRRTVTCTVHRLCDNNTLGALHCS